MTRLETTPSRVVWLAIVFLVVAVMATGCTVDAFNVTQQVVDVKITDVNSGVAIPGASVEFERRYREGWMPQTSKAERDDLWLQRSMNERHSTDQVGMASLLAHVGTLRGGLFPPAFDTQKDRVTGEPYLFRIRANGREEVLELDIAPGRQTCGKVFTVTVMCVSPPREVTQEYCAKEETD